MNEYIEVVENKRGKRRRRMTAKQAKYFGKRKHSRKRRNPVLATLAGNPRHRGARRYHHKVRRHRRHRSHRNPGMFGGVRGLLPFDIRSVLEVGGGIAASKYGPQLVQKYIWAGMPTTGIAGYAVRLGTTIVLAQGVKMITKSSRSAENIMLGGVGSIIYDLFTEYAAPAMGLSGVDGYTSSRVPITEVSTALNDGGVGRYAMPVTMSRLGNLPRTFLS